MKKYITYSLMLILSFVFSTVYGQKDVMHLYSKNGSDIFERLNNIESISNITGNEEANTEIQVLAKDTLYKYSICEIDSIVFTELPELFVSSEEIGNWNEMQIHKTGAMHLMHKNPITNNPEEILMFTPHDSLGTILTYVDFDSNAVPKHIYINKNQIIVNKYDERSVSMTIIFNDSISYTVDEVPCHLELALTRSYLENNWQRNTCAIVDMVTGIVGVTGGAILIAGSVVGEAGTLGASTPISIPGIIAGSVTIAGGVSSFKTGWEKLFNPGNSYSSTNIGDGIYYQGASELISNSSNMVPDEYFSYIKDPNNSKLLSKIGWANFIAGLTSSIVDNLKGKTVTWDDLLKLYKGKVITGLVKDITVNSALVRGYVSPDITISQITGNKIETEYGIILKSANNKEDRYIETVRNGSGGLLEYKFNELKSGTEYKYQTYYFDRTNGICSIGELKSFKTKETPKIETVDVTKATYYPDYYSYNGKKYSFQYKCNTCISISTLENVEEWGYVYEDPEGNKTRIPMAMSSTKVKDGRFAYCRNESASSVKLYGYVKYINDDKYYYDTPEDYEIKYPEDASVKLTDCQFQGTTNNVSYQGKTYKNKSTYKFYFTTTGAYWLKVGTAEDGSGWNTWDLPNYTTSPVDGNNVMTVNYYYDDKDFSGEYNVYLEGIDSTHSKTYKTSNYASYTHSNNLFTGCMLKDSHYTRATLETDTDVVYDIIIEKPIR